MTPAHPRRCRVPLFCCLSLLLVASTAHAADTDDRFTLRLGAMKLPITTRVIARIAD